MTEEKRDRLQGSMAIIDFVVKRMEKKDDQEEEKDE